MMSVRRLGVQDADEAGALLARLEGHPAAAAQDFLTDPRTFVFVADEGGGAVGWLYGYELIRPEGRRAMLLYEIDVVPEARGRGHGRALVEALLVEAASRGHMEMWVLADEDNEAAAALYGSTGAEPVSQVMFTWNLDRRLGSPGRG
jgi:ribosomal protein S18 acetylase RimI-like enzyme